MAAALAQEQFWVDKRNFMNAECQYQEYLCKDYNKYNVVEVDGKMSCEEKLDVNKHLIPAKLGESDNISQPGSNRVEHKIRNAETEYEHTHILNLAINNSKTKKKFKKKRKTSADTNCLIDVSANTMMQILEGEVLDLQSNAMPNLNKNLEIAKAKGSASNSQCTLVSEIAKAREHIKNSLEKMDGIASLAASPISMDVLDRIACIEKENDNLKKIVANLNDRYLNSEIRIKALEEKLKDVLPKSSLSSAAAANDNQLDDDDGVDLFASDSEDENADAARIREERLAAYAMKKSQKPALIAKSSLVLDVKPWDDETDLKAMETEIRKIESDGLLWGASKFAPVAFGIQKLTISCVVEDEKISIDWLSEEIEKLEDYVQSVDVAAFNKI